jgi:hypothetical protein
MSDETANVFPASEKFLEARNTYWAAFEELQAARQVRSLSESDSNEELDLRISELESHMALTKVPFLNRLYEEWFPLEERSIVKTKIKSSNKKTKN